MTLTGNTFFFPWEVSLEVSLQSVLPRSLITVISFFSAFGEEIFLILLLGFMYWSYDKAAGKRIGLSVLAGSIWVPMVKNIALRRRPYFDHTEIQILRPVEPGADLYDISAQGYSFPSGHSTNAVTTMGSLAYHYKKSWLKVLAILIPLLVGFSRVVVGAHYPTDVMAGWLIGSLAVFLIPWLEKKLPNRNTLYALMLAISVPGLFYCRSTDFFTGFGLLVGFICGSMIEEKKVNFENTRNPLRMVLRVLGGGAIYFILNTLLKLPFSANFLESGTTSALMVRAVRYAVIGVLEFSIYPILFKYTAKLKFLGKP